MKRRHFLGSLGAVGLAAGTSTRSDRDCGPPPPASALRAGARFRNVDLPVPEDELVSGASRDSIPAITDPAFGPDWDALDAELDDPPVLAESEQVVGVEVGDVVRAYPLAVLDWHEVVNDTVSTADGTVPLLVTYCPLCRSAIVADRVVAGEPLTFGVSGLLYESDLVLYDTATESLWSQILATAIRGPLTGTELSLRPNTLTTWGAWREVHPDTEVLLPPPLSDTIVGRTSSDYDRDPYRGNGRANIVTIGIPGDIDPRLDPNLTVVGVVFRGAARAYPADRVADVGVVNDCLNGLPVVVASRSGDEPVAYVRGVDGQTVRFDRAGEYLVAGGSRWEITSGHAVDGPHEGTKLTQANDRSPMFWFAWAQFYPETDIWGS